MDPYIQFIITLAQSIFTGALNGMPYHDMEIWFSSIGILYMLVACWPIGLWVFCRWRSRRNERLARNLVFWTTVPFLVVAILPYLILALVPAAAAYLTYQLLRYLIPEVIRSFQAAGRNRRGGGGAAGP